jgi:predicted SprT family Zn-dependent metalloprotease
MPVVKLLGQVYRAVCDRAGCDWRMGGLKADKAAERLKHHMLEHQLTDEAYAIMDEAGYSGDRNVVVQIWSSLNDVHHALGQTRYQERLIVIERRLAEASAYDDTLRHEVAHWVAGMEHGDFGHGPGWMAACARTGAVAARAASLTSDEALALTRYTYACAEGCTWRTQTRHRYWEGLVCGKHGLKVSRVK